MKPRIVIFFTGGTISMRVDPKYGGAVPALSGEEILAQVPGIDEVADCLPINFACLPGPHMTPSKMLELAREVAALLADESITGVVVTHGTDTLEETAYLLDLTLNSEKPIVFVGAMRNSSELSWDGPGNLSAAVRVAADTQARDLGVMVVMGDQLIAASEAIKTHTEAIDTFQSRDFGPLGMVDKDRIIIARHPARREHIPTERLEERIEIIKLSAGADGRLIEFALESGTRGLVLEGLGRGNVPVTAISAVERAINSGMPIVITSRCPRGRILDTYAYEGSGRHLKRLGAILGGLLPSHKARIKLMVMLGAGYKLEQIKASFEG